LAEKPGQPTAAADRSRLYAADLIGADMTTFSRILG
jgi:hypothetical protein